MAAAAAFGVLKIALWSLARWLTPIKIIRSQSTMPSWSARAARGLRAVMGIAAEAGLKDRVHHQGVPDAVSHTVAAQGGIAASFGQHGRRPTGTWHMYDTVKGIGLARRSGRDRISVSRSPQAAVYELEHYGVPFSRTAEGKIYQRAFGGMTQNMGAGPAGAADVRCRRPHRPRDAARALSAEPEARRGLLYRIFRARPDDGQRRALQVGVIAMNMEDGSDPPLPRRTRWCWRRAATGAAYFSATSAHTSHRRRRRHGAPRRRCRCRTWSSSSSTRPESTARACSSPRARAARAAI